MRPIGDGSNVSANLLKDRLDVDLIIGVMREFDVQYCVELAGGDPRAGASVSGSILGVLYWQSVDAEARLSSQFILLRQFNKDSPCA